MIEKAFIGDAFDKCKQFKGFKKSFPMLRDLLKSDKVLVKNSVVDVEMQNCLVGGNIIGISSKFATWKRRIAKKYFEDLLAKGELDDEKRVKSSWWF